MIGGLVRDFQDPWSHQESFRAGIMKVVVISSGKYESKLTRIDLHRLWMHRNETSLPQVMHVQDTSDRCAVAFLVDQHQSPPCRNGDEIAPNAVIVSSINSHHHYRMPGPTRIASMSLTRPDFVAASRALTGRELAIPEVTRQIPVSEQLLNRLRQLHTATCHLAANTPDVLAHPEVAKAMDDELVRAMFGCLVEAETVEIKNFPHLRMPVMQRFEQAIEDANGQPRYLTEICTKIGVQERTLRNHCLECLGMNPHRYLWLRRMNQARHALSVADPAEKTVTAIANDYGFWELGRFSVAYRKLFGEAPSNTLRNPARHEAPAAHSATPAGRLPILP
ncbi:MAG TPA: helix-turn-helix domain-containing protein [Acetobacteraceae bacterium]|jgi:AraC-like DNA-binding protein|nr:helix-turn-helix domain-containing protein [Acetobacteraceae bacterium]